MAITSLKRGGVSAPNLYTLLRIIAGVILLYKSYQFIRDAAVAKTGIQQTGIGLFVDNAEALAFVITTLGLLCGFFITVGLFTRAAAIIQIPILFVAVFFVNIKQVHNGVFELILSVIMLLLLIFLVIRGSGNLSADEYFRSGAAYDRKARSRGGR
jgi:putative oxidoreductase